MLTITDLTVKYGAHTVLDRLNLSLEDAAVHGLVGLNGSGKTTLLNALYGLVKKTGGQISYQGAMPDRKLMSFLPTDNYFYSFITGREYLDFFRYYHPDGDLAPLLDFFPLPLDEWVEHYSTGMKKKLALLAALIPDKEIMIFDEPFNGMDLESVYGFTRLVGQLKNKRKTILITSHILGTLTPVCDQIHYLSAGRILRSFRRDEFPLLAGYLEENLKEKYKEPGGLVL